MNKLLPLISLTFLVACGEQSGDENSNKTEQQTIPEVHIAVLEQRCEPMDLTIKSGKTRFIIENKTQKAVEWEIMQGIRIIDERENILPSFKRKMTTFLDPGEYEITCGLLTNPRGKMVVELAEGAEQFRKPTALELAGALGEFKVFTMTETATLLTDTNKLAAAIAANDLTTAQSLYAPTLQSYERIEPFIKQFADMDRNIAADENLFKDGDNDPNFKGFHKIEKALFHHQTTDGLTPIVQQLLSDIGMLKITAGKTKTSARQLVNFTVALIRESDQSKAVGAKNPYAQTDLMGIVANVEGSQRLFNLTKRMLEQAHPELLKQTQDDYQQLNHFLANLRQNGKMPRFNQLTDDDKAKLKQQVRQLLSDLEQLPTALGVE